MSAEPMYVQLIWEDPETGELQQPLLVAPVAIGRELEQMPEEFGGQCVSRLELASKEISRYHALITVSGTQLYITDKSTNGTYVNGRLMHQTRLPLSSKDTLRIGPYKMTANLLREKDLNATEQNFEQSNPSSNVAPSSPPNNAPLVWLIGVVVLLLMSVGGWVLVSNLLKHSRPSVPDTPASSSSQSLSKSATLHLPKEV